MADGNPYIQRLADDNGNIVTRAISRPHVVSNYFEHSLRVDNHNQSRQHELAMEDAWQTQDCWFRLATTLAGICVTDCWKLAKFHVSASRPYSALTIMDFADISSKTVVYNGLQDHAVPAQRRGRTISVPLGEPKRSSKKSVSTSPVTLAAQKRAEASKLAASAATATWVSFTGRLSIAYSVGFPYVCPAPTIVYSVTVHNGIQ
jgi:hypothetical protein